MLFLHFSFHHFPSVHLSPVEMKSSFPSEKTVAFKSYMCNTFKDYICKI